jgi:hypothetical protein
MGENQQLMDWLLAGPTWVRYRALIDLLGTAEQDELTISARRQMLNVPQIGELINNISNWEKVSLRRHNDADHPLHKLAFLADLGIQMTDTGMEEIFNQILAHQSAEGPFEVKLNIPAVFGGSGKDEWCWTLCDAPLLLWCLVKFGLGSDTRIERGIGYLISLVRENGWPCASSPSLGKFRGPGKREDPCPYANLLMLKLLGSMDEYQGSEPVMKGLQTALALWENRQDQHPYLFRMGDDFCKLKAPLIWYDILHLADVLSYFHQIYNDKRFLEILSIIRSKADPSGAYTPDSVWMKWKGWEFAQKKEPSRWVTLIIARIEKRIRAGVI